jgi:hypothetical protein
MKKSAGNFIPQVDVYSLVNYGFSRKIVQLHKGLLYQYRNLKEVDKTRRSCNYEFDLYDDQGTIGTYFINGYDSVNLKSVKKK